MLDEVLRPGPAWVPCGGTWHRVLLWDGELWAMDHGEIDLEGERVAAVIGRERLTGCIAALADWQERTRRRRLPWLETLIRLDAAASWGVDDIARRDAWVDVAVRSEEVAAAAPFGISAVELLPWVGWLRDPAKIAAWREVGWTSREAEQLDALCLSPAYTAEWRAAGLDVRLILEGVEYEFGPKCAGEWWRAGFTLRDADLLMTEGLELEGALKMKARYGSAARVATMVRLTARRCCSSMTYAGSATTVRASWLGHRMRHSKSCSGSVWTVCRNCGSTTTWAASRWTTTRCHAGGRRVGGGRGRGCAARDRSDRHPLGEPGRGGGDPAGARGRGLRRRAPSRADLATRVLIS